MNIVEKKVSELIPYKNNPRKIGSEAVAKVKASLEAFGFKQPIVVDNENVIIVGHTRLMAAKELGHETVPVLVASDLSPAQAKAYRLADNKTGEFSEWDDEKLFQELSDFLSSEDDFNLEDLGFDMDFGKDEDAPIEEDDFDPGADVEARVKPGEIWRLGEHYLMCGDSTNKEEVTKLLSGGGEPMKADLYLTDPPYNVNYEGKAGKIQNDHMESSKFREFLHGAFSSADEVMKEGSSFYIWYAGVEGYNFKGACTDTGWQCRQVLIWAKNHFTLGWSDYKQKHEPCLYGWKGGASHKWYSDNSQSTLLEFNKPLKSVEHPTMKPVELFAYLIRNSSQKGEIVYDSFGGSGTTLIACEQLGRVCYTMELSPHYCDVILTRWETLSGKKAEKIE